MNMERILLGSIICILMTAPVLAVPSLGWWERGAPGTTYQKWTFNDGDNPAVPEIDQNPYGTAQATVINTGNPDFFGWMTSSNGRSGVWVGTAVDIGLWIPNQPTPNAYKELWLEMGCLAGSDSSVTVIPFYADSTSGTISLIDQDIQLVDSDYGWKRWTVGWKITPNPDREYIYISLIGSGGQIDYVAVDTICIPSPGAFFLSSIGIGLVGWLRKRSII